MKVVKSLLLFSICIVLVSSCFDAPEYPATPQISFTDAYFREVGGNSDADSLVITLSFKDGDGDLGLSPIEIDSPFNEQDYFLGNDGKLLTVRSRASGNTEVPPFETPYNCLNFVYDSLFVPESQKSVFDDTYNVVDTFVSGGSRYYTLLDTFYIQKNPNHYNITVMFLEKQGDGSYTEFDWKTVYPYPNCGETFDGRFPVLARDGGEGALEGNLKYAMKSNGFLPFFGSKTLKLRVQIKDRALNLSNEVEYGDFTLQKIRR